MSKGVFISSTTAMTFGRRAPRAGERALWVEPAANFLSPGGMTVAGRDSLLVITPANRRFDAWRVTLRPQSASTAELAAPSDLAYSKGLLSWSAVDGVAAYRVTPVLIKPVDGNVETELYPHTTIQTLDAAPKLDLSRQLLIGGTYVFEVAAVDREGRVSSATRSSETANRTN